MNFRRGENDGDFLICMRLIKLWYPGDQCRVSRRLAGLMADRRFSSGQLWRGPQPKYTRLLLILHLSLLLPGLGHSLRY